jgi:hypothetical protein
MLLSRICVCVFVWPSVPYIEKSILRYKIISKPLNSLQGMNMLFEAYVFVTAPLHQLKEHKFNNRLNYVFWPIIYNFMYI